VVGYLYIDSKIVGEINFQVIDESMGAIGGVLLPNLAYEVYRNKIQNLCEVNGIANVTDFNFKIILHNNITINPMGGIGVTDMPGFEEIYVESAGISADIINMIRSKE